MLLQPFTRSLPSTAELPAASPHRARSAEHVAAAAVTTFVAVGLGLHLAAMLALPAGGPQAAVNTVLLALTAFSAAAWAVRRDRQRRLERAGGQETLRLERTGGQEALRLERTDDQEALRLERDKTAKLEGVLQSSRTLYHTLNNHLMQVVGHAELVQAQSSDAALCAALQKIVDNGMEGAAIIGKLREMSRTGDAGERDARSGLIMPELDR